jgi:hypothetical protein
MATGLSPAELWLSEHSRGTRDALHTVAAWLWGRREWALSPLAILAVVVWIGFVAPSYILAWLVADAVSPMKGK